MIYTLYSFKGGVGRSMALANLAESFFAKGLRVLMIDWDLEAPGLENYFYSPSLSNGDGDLARASGHRGLIDMLMEYKAKYPEIARQMAATDVPTGSADISSSLEIPMAIGETKHSEVVRQAADDQ